MGDLGQKDSLRVSGVRYGMDRGGCSGVIIPITCSTVSRSVDGCGLSTHSTLNPMPFLML